MNCWQFLDAHFLGVSVVIVIVTITLERPITALFSRGK